MRQTNGTRKSPGDLRMLLHLDFSYRNTIKHALSGQADIANFEIALHSNEAKTHVQV